ncbi:hypothetical protein [Vitiosangium sp. GDMCC 1.1324]|uniref:hypothetical protein n=1 Tax=Vitiosangium sp. (strain GDMCC 1.1324) TaxID=2138576 RepID=UPI000D37E669|nr:hypothetical protein [Vitiosangium sp. GDMCC 1.1324]PTL78350.1 hypothetical protein DAT35_40610 [Vitiosangium sp. GDMCC 1.1324]
MRPALLALALSLVSLPAAAQPEVFFGSGNDVPNIREEDFDRRFLKTGFQQALVRGTKDPNCAQLLAGMLTLLGETAPLLHKRDENFYLDPLLVQALGTQLSTPRFQANVYLVAMVRRVLIDRKMPPDWFQTAAALGPMALTIDVGKLRFISEGLQPIDSFFLTLPALRDRYEIEVRRANSTAASSAEKVFRENYLDRQVAFGGLDLIDLRVEQPKKKKSKKRKNEPVEEEIEEPTAVARLVWYPPDPNAEELNIFGTPKKRAVVNISARLAPQQYLDLSRIPKGTRLMVRGRFWGFKKGLEELELRDGLIFQDRDWSQGNMLADPNAVARCPLAVNDLMGAAPEQSGAFGQPSRR